MPYAEQIISKVDELIAATAFTDKRFTPRLMAGLCQQIPVKSADGQRTIFIPALVNASGKDAVQIVPDDQYNLMTYHRIITNTHINGTAKQQFGDGFPVKNTTSDVIMMVIGFIDKLRLTASQIEALILNGFPSVLDKTFTTGLQMLQITVTEVSSSFDSVALIAQEYRGEQDLIKPNMALLQIRYKIESVYKKGCFNLCDDC